MVHLKLYTLLKGQKKKKEYIYIWREYHSLQATSLCDLGQVEKSTDLIHRRIFGSIITLQRPGTWKRLWKIRYYDAATKLNILP